MTTLYPRQRVESVLQPLALTSAYRIILKPHLSSPLAAYPSKSRFCDGRTYAVLYGASDFATAFVEVVVRDRLMQSDRRIVPFGDIAARGWVEFALAGDEPLRMVDLRESGCLVLGAPTDAAHARNQTAGRALGRALYEQHSDIDGICYRSRLTGGDCLAIFDRALKHLKPMDTGQLEHLACTPTTWRLLRRKSKQPECAYRRNYDAPRWCVPLILRNPYRATGSGWEDQSSNERHTSMRTGSGV